MEVNPVDAFESSASCYSMQEDNIMHIFNKPRAVHSKQDAIENIMMLREMTRGVPPRLLIDVTHIKSISREAREVYANEGNEKRVIAVALLTRSTVGRIVGNFFIGFNRPQVPTKLFEDELKAREWLKAQQ